MNLFCAIAQSLLFSLPLVNRKSSGVLSYQSTQIFTLFMYGGATYHKYTHRQL